MYAKDPEHSVGKHVAVAEICQLSCTIELEIVRVDSCEVSSWLAFIRQLLI